MDASLAFLAPLPAGPAPLPRSPAATASAPRTSGPGLPLQGCAAVAATALLLARQGKSRAARSQLARRATTVEMKSDTDLAPWEIEEETEDERQMRYKREAEEMKLKWDARRLEEKQSAERRIAFAKKEQERASQYGPRDPVMEAYHARMYEEARVIEVRRKQREVYERTKAWKLGRPLPPKGEPYVPLKPPMVEPPKEEEFDVSGWYDPQVDIDARQYKAPESYVSPTGPAPPPRHQRGAPKAAWENPQYHAPSPNAQYREYPEPGSLPAKPRDTPFIAPKAPSAPALKRAPAPAAAAAPAPAPTPAPAPAPAPEPEEEAPANLPTADEVAGMKVPELRAALVAAGMDSKGTKKALTQRLLEAIG